MKFLYNTEPALNRDQMRTKRVFIITCLLISSLSTCYSQVVKDIEGNIYKTVKIGSQEWMTENLRTTKYNDRESIPLIVDNSVWGKGENAEVLLVS